jgi:YbbR domain-containing protein
VDLTVPVVYVGFPDNKTMANTLPEKIALRVKAHGFTIIRHRLSLFFLPLEFDVNAMTENRMRESNKSSFAFPSRQFLTELGYLLSNDMEILNMSPDTLSFRFDELSEKRIKVKPVLSIKLKKQFQISGPIQITPDSVTVSGPRMVIDTIRYAFTETIKFQNLDQPVQTTTNLQTINHCFFEPRQVELKFPVEEFTEAQQMVQVNTSKLPSGMSVKLFPSKVKLTFQVSLGRFAEIKPEDFKLIVSYDDIRDGKQRLKIKADSVPEYLYSLKINPEELEYLIEK